MTLNIDLLREHLARISDLYAVSALLDWDQQVNMPPGGSEARAHQLATVASLAHHLFVADETGEMLERAAEETATLPYHSDDASLVRVTAREYERMRRVPESLIAEQARATSRAFNAWQAARAESDFDRFRPHLERVVELTIEYAEAIGYEECLYDALLDQFEPEMRTAEVVEVFKELKEGILPLLRSIADRGHSVDDAFLDGVYADHKQWEFGTLVLKDMGFDFERGRQDRSAHPFTTAFSPDDVRLTTRVRKEDFQSALFGTIHEGGHALYDQGIRRQLDRTPLFEGASCAVHESQSRLWENVVARSRGFWSHYLPLLRAFFPEPLGAVELQQFYRAINKVSLSLVRVEADEVSYSLHIFLRFELEQDLLERRLEVADLPEAWNAKTEEYLGLTPPNDALGVLQDVHWSGGAFGYFPSYAMGNLLATQFYDQALREIPQIPEQIARGEFDPLRAWLADNIHRHGKKFTPAELVERITADAMQAGPFLAYLREKYGEIYGVNL